MKVYVDQELCIGDETCVEICPEIFEMVEDDDVAVAKVKEVPAELEASCREAQEACPVDAIIIEE